MLIWKHPGGSQLLAERGIVRSHELATVTQLAGILGQARYEAEAIRHRADEEAGRIVAQARAQASQLVDEANRQADSVREQAAQAADDEYKRAYDEGRHEAAQEWHTRLAELQAAHDALFDGMEDRLAAIVAIAVERIVRAEPREAAFSRALQGVREAMRDAGSARLRVHPDEAPAAQAALAADAALLAEGPRVVVEADPALPPGACIFESPWGQLDASLDVQLAGMRAALQRATRGALAEAGERPAAGADTGHAPHAHDDEAHHGNDHDDHGDDDDPYQDDSDSDGHDGGPAHG